jgi:hypothetical protein
MDGGIHFPVLFAAFLALVVLSFKRSLRKALERLIDEINRRGGPPPTHPVPAGDEHLLHRRSADSNLWL